MEQWKPVVGFEGIYEVSNLGRVKTLKTNRIKKPTPNNKDKRLLVLLWKENKYKAMKVHRLVLTAFVGPNPLGMECCHNDGNARNNRLDNLRWDTPSSNQHDRTIHGTSNRGERCASSKLKECQVREIIADPRPHPQIAAQYGVRANTICRIKSGARWAWIQRP